MRKVRSHSRTFLLQLLVGQYPETWRARITCFYGIVCLAAVCMAVMLPVPFQIALRNWFSCLIGPPMVTALILILRMALRGIQNNLLLLLTSLAFVNHFAWWTYDLAAGTKVVYYPFDLLLALITFSMIWFKRYFELYAEQNELSNKLKQLNKQKDEFLAPYNRLCYRTGFPIIFPGICR